MPLDPYGRVLSVPAMRQALALGILVRIPIQWGFRVQRVWAAEGLRDTAHVGALSTWGARNDLDVVVLSPLELGEVRHVRLNPAESGQVEVADVRDFHRLRTLNSTNRLQRGRHIRHKVTAARTLVLNHPTRPPIRM